MTTILYLFLKIEKRDDFWLWYRDTLVPAVYEGDWYNGAKKSQNGYILDRESYLVGIPRLRMLRIGEGMIISYTKVYGAGHF